MDVTRWPIVVMVLRGALTTEEYEKMLDASEQIHARREAHVGVVDLREMTASANAAQRKLIAARSNAMDRKYGHVSLGNIMIVNSALMRGALTAVEWLRGRKKKDHWVGSMDEALANARRLLNDHAAQVKNVS